MTPIPFRIAAALALGALLTACERPAPESAQPDAAPAARSSGPESPSTDAPGADPSAAVAESAYDVPPVPGEGFDTERFVADMKTLASDAFEGRAPGSRGERLTVDLLVERFAEVGLEPGFGASYLQPVPMVELTNQSRTPITIERADGTFELTYPEQMIIGTRRLGTASQGIEDSELVFVGYGIVAPEYDWNDYAGIDVDGKTVVMLVNDPGYADPDSGLFNGRAMTYYGRWTYKYEEAARQGAAAALIVHQTEPASYPWEVVTNSWSGPQFELAARGDAPIMALEGWVTVDAARDLFGRAGLDFDETAAAAARPDFDAIDLGARATASVRNSVREGVSYNVAARLPGSEAPDETVVYMAHWDHLGRNMAVPGSAGIFNGAIDNASGTAALLEIGRLHAAAGRPRRSLLFLAVTLEEYGLLGSRHYVNRPVVPAARTVAAINMDAFNYMAGPTEDMVAIGYGSSELEDILAATLAESNRILVEEPTPEAGFYYRSDHFNFARAGIPSLYAKSGVQHVEHGADHVLAIERDYRDNRYHKPADAFDPDWDFRGAAQDAAVLYRVGRYLAESEAWPNWYEGNEFRALRDDQRRSEDRRD
jgi:Zn-dependent M28 family amino/carboxypeptidase